MTCAGMSRHRAATGRFHCGECWTESIMAQGREPSEMVKRYAMSGASGTHRGYSHYVTLESEWAAQM